MGSYRDKEEMVRILSALWERIFNAPEIMNSVSGTKLLVKFRITDPDANLYIDIRGERPLLSWDPDEPEGPDVEMIMSSDTCHKFWMEKLNIPLAIAGRKVVAKGSIRKALKLLPALKPAFAIYPEVLREMKREDLLARPEKAKRRWRFSFFKAKKKKHIDLEALPEFPLELVERIPPGELKPARPSKREVTDVDLLRTMHTIRAFEEHLAYAFRENEIPTEAIHLSIGQEAVAAGVCMNLRDTDYLNTTHRGHGHIIAKGADLSRMMAEIYGKAQGLCGGRGGSMHVTDGSKGILGANGIVGAGYLLAMGAGLTIKRQDRDDVSVVISGDGSVNQGMFHEAVNMAALFELPVLFVVENNLYGEFTPIGRHSAVTELFKRAHAYGTESSRLNGNDVNEVFTGVGRAIEKMRKDGKPRLIELMTYRWHGHMEGDPELYRTDDEKESYKKECPIARLQRELLAGGVLDEEGIAGVKREALAAVGDAVDFAKKAASPGSGELLDHVYAPEEKALFVGEFSNTQHERNVSVSQAINEALAEELQRDERVFLWGEDVTLGGYLNVTEGLVDKFGSDRIIDTPISENGLIGGAVGAAMTGLRPVVEILFSDFLPCCMDPIFNQAAKLRYMTGGQVSIPLTIRTPVGSGIGMAAQHSQSMERYFFGIPGLMVAAPSDAYTAKGLLKAAIRAENPIIFFEHKLLYANVGKVPAGDYILPLGKARVVREGEDVTMVTHLLGVGVAMDVSRILSSVGIEAEVVDLVTLYPLDMKTVLDSVAKTGHLVTIEEGTPTGGIGSEVITRVALFGTGLLKGPPLRVASPECPVPYARDLECAMIPDPRSVAERIEKALG